MRHGLPDLHALGFPWKGGQGKCSEKLERHSLLWPHVRFLLDFSSMDNSLKPWSKSKPNLDHNIFLVQLQLQELKWSLSLVLVVRFFPTCQISESFDCACKVDVLKSNIAII